jgi:hypothetical protein
MKVKDIVHEDGPMPQMGKVTAQQPGVGGAPGMVTVTMSNGVKQMIPSNMIGTGPDGKPMINTQQQPGQNGQQPTTTQPPSGTTGQPPVTMGQDVKVQEEPNTMDPANNTNTYYVNYGQMAAKVGNKYVKIMPSKMWFDLTPEVAGRANAQGFSTIYLSVNGKSIPGVMGGDQNLGSRIDIAPRDYQLIQGMAGAQQQNNKPMQQESVVSRIAHLAGLK